MTLLDQIPVLLVFGGSVLAQVLFIELGFRYGLAGQRKGVKAQLAQVRAIMGASLGLLAFMLAFSFSMAQQHFDDRTRAYMEEVTAIDSAYRLADLLPEDQGSLAQGELRQFARLRIETMGAARAGDMEHVLGMIRESERIHDLLWGIAESSLDESGQVTSANSNSSPFAQAVLAMVQAHDARLQTAIFNRISPVIWITLFLMALVSMVVMGYQAGLTGTRSSLATWALALTFSAVMMLITDLDRPNMSLFDLNQGLMLELLGRMDGTGAG